MVSLNLPFMGEEHYRCSTIADRFDCSTDYVEKEIRRYDATQGKEGLGPSFLVPLYNDRGVSRSNARVVPASAVLAWRERSRIAM